MAGKSLKTHGPWSLGLIASFYLGTYWNQTQVQTDPNPENASNSAASGSTRGNSPSSRSAANKSQRSEQTPKSRLDSIFNSTPFAQGDIEALTLEALRDPNQVKRRLAFSRLLRQMTPENSSTIRDQLLAAGVDGKEWRDFNYAWGALAGEEAFTNALTSEKQNLESLISGWAATDPAGAIAMLTKLPPELAEQQKRLENGIVAGLADRDRNEATQYVATLLAGGREDTGRLMATIANEVLRKSGPAEASAWVSNLEDGPLKGPAMSEVAQRYVRSDPEAAAGWVEQFADQDYATRAVAQVGRSWAEREPLAAVGWLDQLPEGPGQKAGLNSAFGDWEDKDPIAAGNYLLSMPGSPKRDSAISGFAAGYAWQDPQTALAWANDIQDPGMRTESLKQVGSAFFRRNPEEAKIWLQTSGLPAEVQAEIQAPRRRGRRR